MGIDINYRIRAIEVAKIEYNIEFKYSNTIALTREELILKIVEIENYTTINKVRLVLLDNIDFYIVNNN